MINKKKTEIFSTVIRYIIQNKEPLTDSWFVGSHQMTNEVSLTRSLLNFVNF